MRNIATPLRLGALAALLLGGAPPALAAQEPFGEDFWGWRFTQEAVRGGALCRAFSPGPTAEVIIQRRNDGTYVLSVPGQGLRRGQYEGANLEAGGQNQMTNARSDGSRATIDADAHDMANIIRARGFSWAAGNRQGRVAFAASVEQAVQRLRACNRANGGR